MRGRQLHHRRARSSRRPDSDDRLDPRGKGPPDRVLTIRVELFLIEMRVRVDHGGIVIGCWWLVVSENQARAGDGLPLRH